MMNRQTKQQTSPPHRPTPWEIVRQVREPKMRVEDAPWLMHIADAVLLHPECGAFQERLAWGMVRQAWQAAQSTNPFYGAYPPLSTPYSFDVLSVQLPDERPFGLQLGSLFRTTGLVGPHGSGKSSHLRLLLAQLPALGCVIVFDRKRELRALAGIPNLGKFWLVLPWTALKIALLQPPPNMPRGTWFVEVLSLLARNYGLQFSRFWALPLLDSAYAVDKDNVNLSGWIKQVRASVPGKGYNEQNYKVSTLAVLTNLRRCAGIFDYAKSNCLELLFSGKHGVIIEVDSLPAEIYSFFVSFLIRWLYQWRLHTQ